MSITLTGPRIKLGTPKHFANFDPLQNHYGYQCFVYDSVGRRFFMSQAVPGSIKGAEHTLIHEFDYKMKYVTSMKLFNFGHGGQIGIDHVIGLHFWVPCARFDPKTKLKTNNHLARVEWTPGKTLTINSAQVRLMDIFTGRFSQAAVDEENDLICIRTVDKDNNEFFTRRFLSELMMQTDHALDTLGPFSENEFSQGFALYSDTLYRYNGYTDAGIKLREYSFRRGITSGVLRDLSTLGAMPNERLTGNLYREPEGVYVVPQHFESDGTQWGGLLTGVKLYGGTRKRLRLFNVAEWPYFLHRVSSGENLSKIAAQYECDWEELATYNQLVNANRISIGQVLRIPR
jgi:hypothetical protein